MYHFLFDYNETNIKHNFDENVEAFPRFSLQITKKNIKNLYGNLITNKELLEYMVRSVCVRYSSLNAEQSVRKKQTIHT